MKPTERQLEFITTIEDEIGGKFTGDTKEQASEWISKNIPKFKEAIDNRMLVHEIEMECMHYN